MMENFDFLKTRLAELDASHLLRTLRRIDSSQGPVVTIEGRRMVLFCSNNYLSLANHPSIVDAACKAANEYGYGSCSSHLSAAR